MTWDLNGFEKRVLDPKKITILEDLQFRILSNAYNLVKDGGEIFYSTCSFSIKQNEDIVKKFLQEHDDCILADALGHFDPVIREQLLTNLDYGVTQSELDGCIRFVPSKYNTGALFLSRIIKNKSTVDKNEL